MTLNPLDDMPTDAERGPARYAPPPAVPVQSVTVALAFEPTALAVTQAQAAVDFTEIETTAKAQPDGLYPIPDATTRAAVVGYLQEKLREYDAIEKMRLSATQPLNQTKRTIDGWFKPAKDYLEGLCAILRKSLEADDLRQLEVRRAALAAATTAVQKHDVPALTTALAAVNTTPEKTAGFSTQAFWVAEVIAPDLLQPQWLTPDEEKIQAYADQFTAHQTPTPIPGVRFTLGTSSRVQRKK